MTVLRTLFAPQQRAASLSDALASRRLASTVSAGVNVTTTSALNHPAVAACVNVIADQAVTLPLHAYRDVHKLTPGPQLLRNPSGTVDRDTWIGQAVTGLLLFGNCVGVIHRNRRGEVIGVELVNPDDAEPVQTRRYAPVERWKIGGADLDPDRVMHIVGRSLPGNVWGMNPIDHAKQTIGTGLAAEKFGAKWYGQGGHPSGVLRTDATHITAEEVELVKDRFQQMATEGGTTVLTHGLQYDRIQASPADGETLESQRFSAQQICRIFGVPPEMVGLGGDGKSVTYANREQQAQHFVAFGLMPWLVRIERALARLLPGPVDVKFNVSGLLRADAGTRYQNYATGLEHGFLHVDEVRRWEELPPRTDLAPSPRKLHVDFDGDAA